jgi:hypothetical protein
MLLPVDLATEMLKWPIEIDIHVMFTIRTSFAWWEV